MSARRRRRHTQIDGLIPSFLRGVWGSLVWVWTHPQPALVSALIAVIFWGLWKAASRAESFKIARIEVPASSELRVPDGILGRNIWAVDIDALAREFVEQQPWLEGVRVVRALPNGLEVSPIRRIPVARVYVGSWHPVDRKGYILPTDASDDALALTKLVGFRKGDADLNIGGVNDDATFQRALRVLQVLDESPALLTRRVEELDVSNPRQIRFVIDGDTEVRCGSEEDLPVHLERLRAALKVMKDNAAGIRYIDLRFEDPVVSSKG